MIIHQGNLHIGLSRNDGLQLASGEYIAFADHDDYCDPEMYERLYAVAKLLGQKLFNFPGQPLGTVSIRIFMEYFGLCLCQWKVLFLL